MENRTHKYAENAYRKVENLKKDIKEKYRTLALSFPTMIMQSGLAQAVGFLMAKGGEEHKEYLNHLAEILNFKDANALHTKILESDISQYQLLTRQALDASAWLKRYVQALLKEDIKEPQ